jgi:signal transduction histidine kinase/CheY-like chemotaxis protein
MKHTQGANPRFVAGAVLSAFGAVALLVALWFPQAERRSALAALQHKAETQARLIAYSVAPAIDFSDAEVVQEAFRGASGDVDFIGISATDPLGEEVAHLGQASAAASERRIVVERAIALADGREGLLRLVMRTDRIDAASERQTLISSGIGATIFLFGVLVAWWVSQSIRRTTKLVEENARARAAAEQANVIKTRFLANMSHEMRTPLNGVLGLSDVLSRRALDADSMSLVRSMGRSARTLLALVNDLLDLSRVEAGKLELEHVPIDPEAAAAAVCEMFLPGCRQKGIELVLEVDGNVPQSVLGDRLRLEQVLTNLVGNAVKFTSVGAVRLQMQWQSEALEVSVIDSGIGIAADKLESIFDAFSQADTSTTRQYGGSGLGLAISRRIAREMGGELTVTSTLGGGSTFTLVWPCEGALPFDERLHRAGKAFIVCSATHTRALLVKHAQRCLQETSEGLFHEALERAKEEPGLVVLWDASAPPPSVAELESVQRLATTQRLHLIVHAAPLDELSLREQAATILPTGFVRDAFDRALEGGRQSLLEHVPSAMSQLDAHVLLAEDDATNQLVASSFLKELGVTSEVVGNGLQALERVMSGTRFDVVLMDCQMPVMDGYEAARKIRAWEAEKGILAVPIIAVTAHALPEERARAAAAGMDGYLTKPLTLESFRGALAERAPERRSDRPAASPPASESTFLSRFAGNRELIARLRKSFAEGAEKALLGMAAAKEKADWTALSAHAHTLKGACLSLGAEQPAELARELEVLAKAQRGEGVDGLLLRLEVAVEDTMSELDEALIVDVP